MEMRPFGEVLCESEVKKLGAKYPDFFFRHTPFTTPALKRDTYLIVGRRGSGKTSLANYLTFQSEFPGAKCIDVEEEAFYNDLLLKIAATAGQAPEVAIPRIVRVWNYLIWCLVFRELKDCDPVIAAANLFGQDHESVKALVLRIAKHIVSRFLKDDMVMVSEIEEFLSNETVDTAKQKCLEVAKQTPIIVAIDSLERYSIDDETMMRAVAALIQTTAIFNQDHAQQGLMVKLFLPAEVFPYLQEAVVSNPTKYIANPLYLQWRPKDLIRLVGWRFHHFLTAHDIAAQSPGVIDWDNFRSVHEKAWVPYFGSRVVNRNGRTEDSFAYLLRHTQLRPRQLVFFCNDIAGDLQDATTIPSFSSEQIVESIGRKEIELATEVLNAYDGTYPNVAQIVSALAGSPAIFRGNELDRIAHRTASQWKKGDYSPAKFRQLVAELGIVGRVRERRDSGHVMADFEYATMDRLHLNEQHLCVIHPLFYRKFGIQVEPQMIVYPFPDRPEFAELNHGTAAAGRGV